MSKSRIEDIVDGKLAWTEVDLLDIGDSSARVLRSALEELGIRVNYLPIGQPRHVIAALGGDHPIAPYVIVSCHGDSGSIILPELGGTVADAQPFVDRMGPEQVERYLRIPGSVVISTGCETGEPALAQAFLRAGAGSYFAPTDAPDGYAAFVAVLLMFYELTEGRELLDAAERVRTYNDNLSMWRLWHRSPDVRQSGCN
ncbi:hypothetical protein [Nocardia blacklockiae]|uniref:hypothetical protein n=1 Tax=Nocardia blacklockiae TaxID=480036 RepID=UPI0018943EC6|nr:hypothetical protein [Nocardia blacklockiae]MBF6174437.1 hypothetical protein [Nocardia blacklockiae]